MGMFHVKLIGASFTSLALLQAAGLSRFAAPPLSLATRWRWARAGALLFCKLHIIRFWLKPKAHSFRCVCSFPPKPLALGSRGSHFMHRKLIHFAACLPLRHCDSQPYSGCQSRRFLENASLDLPQAALQRFPPLLDRFSHPWYKDIEVIPMRFKDEMIEFLSSPQGKLLMGLSGLGVLALLWLCTWL